MYIPMSLDVLGMFYLSISSFIFIHIHRISEQPYIYPDDTCFVFLWSFNQR